MTHEFVEHPSSIPIDTEALEISSYSESAPGSFWGLKIQSVRQAPLGAPICITFALGKGKIKAQGKIVRCEANGDGYDLWVQFSSFIDCHKARMAEQACQMEAWRKEQESHGETLEPNLAYSKWLNLFSSGFPAIEQA
jgi:hypothetical protein